VAELIDILTPDGAPTGARKTKAEVHRDGDWHRAAHVWIVTPDGRLLLQRRSLRKENYPGLWDVSAAGHVSAGETAVECAVRETFEELGLRIGASELQFLGTLRESCVLNGGTYIDNEIHEVFVVRRDVDLSALTLQDGEVDSVMLVRALPRDGLVPHAAEYSLIDGLPKK
jgi:isopentenyldiphosphate isomerase